MIDKQTLLDHLRERLAVMKKNPLARAIYAELIMRIERGDFDLIH